MSKTDYEGLTNGDVVRSTLNGTTKTIQAAKGTMEPTTQITKDRMLDTYTSYEIIAKKK